MADRARCEGVIVKAQRREVLHVLYWGLPLCRFSYRAPSAWPKGHRWVSLTEWLRDRPDLCAGCREELGRYTVHVELGGHAKLLPRPGFNGGLNNGSEPRSV